MKTWKTLFALIISGLFALPASSWGWAERGNGADVISCNASAPFELLDIYEGRVQFGLRPNFSFLPLFYRMSFQDVAIAAMIKINENVVPHDPVFAQTLRDNLVEFGRTAQLVPFFTLLDIKDEGPVDLTQPDCKIRQLIVQHRTKVPGVTNYLVSFDLWLETPFPSKIGGALHEAIYRAVLNQNPAVKDSAMVRHFNALILSDRMKTMTQDEYVELRNQLLH